MSKMTKEKKQETKTETKAPEKQQPQGQPMTQEKPAPQEPRMREIIIQTNGSDIRITKNETAGVLELSAILQALLGSLTQKK